MEKTVTDFIRPRRASEIFGISESMVRQWIMSKKIPSYKMGRATFLKKSEVEKLIERGRVVH